MRRCITGTIICLLLAIPIRAIAVDKPYFYPYVNPFEATVMELPPYYGADIPDEVPLKTFKVKPFPERVVPEVFWYEDGLKCSLAYQDEAAPLVFIVAGTGASFNSPKVVNLQKALHQAGYHVVAITSPTHMHFIVNASSSMTPGHLYEDSKDVYRVMKLAMDKVKDDIEVLGYHLTGYSLGGIQAAFVSLLDEEENNFNFERVLLINPPVSLYNSITILDSMLTQNIPGGANNIDSWFDNVMQKVADAEEEMGYLELSGEYIYKAYKRFPPREDFLASLVGVSFRNDSANMIFTADVMKGGGYITPQNVDMSNSTSLTPFYLVAQRTSFENYFKEHFTPFYTMKDPSLTEDKLKEILSLRTIEDYLRTSPKIGLLHNEDDIIMKPGEITYLQSVFERRAKIFPTGGHCGNMNHQDVVEYIVKFFAGQEG